MPPPKFAGDVVPVPWQTWQEANPPDAEGACFATGPCCVAWAHPAGWPASLWHIVPLKHPGAVPAGAGEGGTCGLSPFAVPV